MSALTGEVRAVSHDEMVLTDVRTGLGSAIASKTLAKSDARKILIVGTGAQTRWQIEAHKALMPQLTHYELWGRNTERAQQVISNAATIGDVLLARDLKQAVQKADVVVTATGSTHPIIQSDWVKDGTQITIADLTGIAAQDIAISNALLELL
jgi:ornithine cyclodeaminase/alanine dehydrogenase-like protein (mu-crystallin family)